MHIEKSNKMGCDTNGTELVQWSPTIVVCPYSSSRTGVLGRVQQ
jgi:hypothetical protein